MVGEVKLYQCMCTDSTNHVVCENTSESAEHCEFLWAPKSHKVNIHGLLLTVTFFSNIQKISFIDSG